MSEHAEHDRNAAAHKIQALHQHQIDEQLHPEHHAHGVDPLHQDHKEHIVHKAVAHGHHDAKPAADAKAAPAAAAAPAADAKAAPKK